MNLRPYQTEAVAALLRVLGVVGALAYLDTHEPPLARRMRLCACGHRGAEHDGWSGFCVAHGDEPCSCMGFRLAPGVDEEAALRLARRIHASGGKLRAELLERRRFLEQRMDTLRSRQRRGRKPPPGLEVVEADFDLVARELAEFGPTCKDEYHADELAVSRCLGCKGPVCRRCVNQGGRCGECAERGVLHGA